MPAPFPDSAGGQLKSGPEGCGIGWVPAGSCECLTAWTVPGLYGVRAGSCECLAAWAVPGLHGVRARSSAKLNYSGLAVVPARFERSVLMDSLGQGRSVSYLSIGPRWNGLI